MLTLNFSLIAAPEFERVIMVLIIMRQL